MLELLKAIFPCLIALYVLDCIAYLNKHQFIIGTLAGGRFNLKKNGIHFVGLLPSSQIYLAQNLPTIFTAEGMYYVPYDALNNIGIYGAEDFSFLPYTESGGLEIDEKSLKYKQKTIIKGPSYLYIRNLLQFLRNLNSGKPQDRNSIIENYLSELYDIDEVRKVKEAGAPQLLYLYIFTYLLFSLVFIITPVTIYSDLYRYINLYLLVGYILAVYLIVLFCAGRLNKKLFHPDKGIRTLSFLSLIFSPVNTIHASIYITKNLYHAFDLTALAAVFLRQDSFREIARKEFLSTRKLQAEGDHKNWNEYLIKKEAHLLKTIEETSFSLEEIIAPPDKQDESAEKYCPICLTEYTRGSRNCSDCETELENYAY